MSFENAPSYVKLGLFGVKTRKASVMYMLITAALAIGLAVYFKDVWMLLLLLAAVWYWTAVKWMDVNDGWRTK